MSCAATSTRMAPSTAQACKPLQRHSFLSGTRLTRTSPVVVRNRGRRDLCVNAKIGFDVYQFEGLVDPEVGFFWTSVVLSATLVSFLGTFAMSPYLSKVLKEPDSWREIYPKLIERGTQSLEPELVAKKLNKGIILLDVSMANSSMKVDGSVQIPLYQPIEGWSIPKTMRRAGFAAFGVEGTELNPAWLEQVEATIPKDKEIYVVDTNGGSLESKKGLEFGTQSRSLKAVYRMQNAGFKNVNHVKGGLRQWARDELPVEFSEDSGAFSLPF
ncbi:hypothetical protein BSKO_11801 [Bryopsis sp. KO-2023]|nr:hypothetical protein BSKO_11801 [Bryopsis sp. KO-2023]